MERCPVSKSGNHYWNPVQVKSVFEPTDPHATSELGQLYDMVEYQYLFCSNCAASRKVRVEQ